MSDVVGQRTAACVIPARGGSKRIPRKNVRPFHGRPLITWSIDAARRSGLFTTLIVSTDDDEIAEVSRAAGAEVPFHRPGELADDTASTDAALLHAARWLIEHGPHPELLCCAYATAPFLTPEILRGARDVMLREGADGSATITTFDYPVWRALRRGEGDRIEFEWPEHRVKRSQDLPELFHDAGLCYWTRTRPYVDGAYHLLGPNTVGYRIPRWCAQDIDTEEDWHIAELLHQPRMPNDR